MKLISPALNSLRKIKRRQTVSRTVSDQYWADRILQEDWDLLPFEFRCENGSLWIDEFNISLERDTDEFFLDGILLARDIATTRNATFSKSNGDLVVNIDDFSLVVQNSQELFILQEIFCAEVYNLIQRNPMVLIDVGMNVGFASLYFAQKEEVMAVYGYEPFKPTYDQALRNFRLNPKYSQKIHHFNFGLARKDEVRKVEYSSERRGSMGIDGLIQYESAGGTTETQEIELKNVSKIIGEVHSSNPDLALIVKIDTEGSEYEIIDALAENDNNLNLIDGLMLEWHDSGQNENLVKTLLESGFRVVSLNPHSTTIGSMYAFR